MTEPEVFDDDMDARFAESVSELRKARGWSQEKLAELMTHRGVRDMSALSVSRIESGRRKIRLNEAVTLAQIFGVPLLAMTRRDPLVNAMVGLSGLARNLRRWESEFIEAAEKYSGMVHETANLMLRQIESMRRRGDLYPDAEEQLSKFELRARYALEQSPAVLAADAPWPWKSDGERQAEA